MTQLSAVDVYLGTGSDDGIFRVRFNPSNGKLDQLQVAAELDRPSFLAFHPSRKVLYAAGTRDKQALVVAYRILSDGALELLNESPIADDEGAHLAVHPSGAFLITAQYGAGTVGVFPLDADGCVGACAQTVQHKGGSMVNERRQKAPHPHWTGFSPDGRFAFVPDLGMDKIVIYKVEPEGPSLEPAGAAETEPGAGPRHMRFSTDGRFIFLMNELSLTVTTFAYDAETGAAKRLSSTPALSEAVIVKEDVVSGSEILVHPNGRFVYSGTRGHDSVTAYRIDPETGALVVVDVEPVRGSWPRNIALDSSGRWLLAAGRRSNTLAVFKVDPENGELTFPRSRVLNVPDVTCVLIND